MKKFNLKKMMLCIMLILSMAAVLPIGPVYAADDDDTIAFTVSGEGVDQTVEITMAELKALPQVTYTYSGYNHWPSLQVFKDATGPTLESVLKLAGLKKDSATMIKFSPFGGEYAGYTVKELLKDERYYYPDGVTGDLGTWPPNRTEEGKTTVPTIIGLSYKGSNGDTISLDTGKLFYGQRSPLEPTACKSEQMESFLPNGKILVTTEIPETWEAPDASVPSGTVVPGTKVTLQHGDGTPYGALVYYTLDGSEPTVKSSIANISYPNFQPQLNAPIPITQNVTIKARTIGIGKLDSPVATYQYDLGSLACTIKGEGLVPTTDYAVETLKAMSPVTGDYQNLESGESVTLTGEGVLLETLLNNLSASNLWKVKFVTSEGQEYDGGTVQDLKTQKCMLAYKVNGASVADVSNGSTTYIQILRNQNDSSAETNRLKNITTIQLINVDDQITISSVSLLDNKGTSISSVAPGGGYCIEVNLANKVMTATDALLIFQVRYGDEATPFSGGKAIAFAAVQSRVAVDGGKATAEFTMPSGIKGTAYVDIYIWDNASGCQSLGTESHSLNFEIK